jgi:gamma-glutamyltranspeptidase/glutathione hydrolase
MYLDRSGNVTQDSAVGYRAAGVPGTVRGLELAWRKYGKKSWAEVLAPAVELASKGFPVGYLLAESLRESALLARFPESRRIFQRDGRFYEAGELLVQPELARTLERIRKEGSRDFYEGETARRLAADMQAHGGLISLADLKDYSVAERQPLTGRYRGYDVITAPPPSSGGVGLLQMLGMLEGTGYEKSGAGSAASLHMLADTMLPTSWACRYPSCSTSVTSRCAARPSTSAVRCLAWKSAAVILRPMRARKPPTIPSSIRTAMRLLSLIH